MEGKKVLGVASAECGKLSVYEIGLRALRSQDVELEVLYCGVCHTDVHYIEGDWEGCLFPVVPGHEVVGVVRAVGCEVTRVRVGDHAGVGYIVWSCGACDFCESGAERFCQARVPAMGGRMPDGEITKGGWMQRLVCPDQCVVKIPSGIELSEAAPLLCAGLTVYHPLAALLAGPTALRDDGSPALRRPLTVGVVGVGGLGHLAIMFARSWGARVVAMDYLAERCSLALELGASEFVCTADTKELSSRESSLHHIIDTASAPKDIEPYIRMLRPEGSLVLVGLPPSDFKFALQPALLAFTGKRIVGTLTGSVADAEEMFRHVEKHNIRPLIELTTDRTLQEDIHRLLRGQVRCRLVLDLKNSFQGITDAPPLPLPIPRGAVPTPRGTLSTPRDKHTPETAQLSTNKACETESPWENEKRAENDENICTR